MTEMTEMRERAIRLAEATRLADEQQAEARALRAKASALYRDAAALKRRASELPHGYSGERAAMIQMARRGRGEAATLDVQAGDLECAAATEEATE